MFNVCHLAASFIFAAAISLSASAATFNVNTTSDIADGNPGDGICASSKGICTLRAAITESNIRFGTDTINIPAGTYYQTIVAAHENANAGGDWDVTDTLILVGNQTILRGILVNGQPGERVMDVVNINAQLTASGINFFAGRARAFPDNFQGGGIRSLGDLVLTNVTVQDNWSHLGGGIYVEGSLTMTSSIVTANNADYTGEAAGGGIMAAPHAGKIVNLIGSDIRFNCANCQSSYIGIGGGLAVIAAHGFAVNISGGRVRNNEGGGPGSAGAGLFVRAAGSAASVNLNNLAEFTENFFNPGGASTSGNGIHILATNGAIMNGTWDRIKMHRNPVIPNNADDSVGGNAALDAEDGSINIALSRSIVLSGYAWKGGGISVENGSTGTATLNATNTSFIYNKAFQNPSVPINGDGGAIYVKRGGANVNAATVNLNFCTFSNNGGVRGSAIFNDTATPGRVNIRNSVVDFHSGNSDLFGAVFSQNYNHYEQAPGANVTLGTNEAFGYTGLVWGPNNEYLIPLTTSPLINMISNGTNTCGAAGGGVTNDQRSQSRPFNGACDKGAIELQELGQG